MTLLDNIEGSWRPTPRYVSTADGTIDSQVYANQGKWDELASLSIYEQQLAAGEAPLGYNDPLVEVDGDRSYAVRYPAGTDQERDEATRTNLEAQIEQNRMLADQRKIDLTRDPGLTVLMDEANANAETKLEELDGTTDADLPLFDPTFDPQAVGAVATARSLVVQEAALLNDPGLTSDEVIELEDTIVLHQAIVDAGDDTADVPPVPSAVRRAIGVAAEGYGKLIARREFTGGWWWLNFELQLDRELDVDDYWLAVYEGTTYLTTPRLTEVSPGVYKAGNAAVNLPRINTDSVFSFTLCHGHITAEQFDPVTLGAGVERQRYRARWGGSTT